VISGKFTVKETTMIITRNSMRVVNACPDRYARKNIAIILNKVTSNALFRFKHCVLFPVKKITY
jgi:hypothetical protein